MTIIKAAAVQISPVGPEYPMQGTKKIRAMLRTNKTETEIHVMNAIKFLKAYAFIIVAVLVLIFSGQQASTYGQTPEPAATPRITPGDFVDALNGAFGKQTTSRATHAKGIVLSGKFTPTSQAVGLSKALHFKQAVPITVRFSDNTGIPTLADGAPQARPLGMSIKFHLPDGTDTDLVTHSLNGFPAKTPEDMRQFILAIIASGPGVAAPTPIQKYLEAHPEAKPFATAPGPAPVSYGTIPYFGVNTFKFIAADGTVTFGRYQIIPETGKEFLPKDDLANASHDYLLEEIRTRVGKGPVRFKFVLQLSAPGDKLDDPSIPWSDTNKTIELGTIEITSVVPDSDATQRALLFLPSLLPDGIEPADPMIRFRGLAYPVSYDRRHP